MARRVLSTSLVVRRSVMDKIPGALQDAARDAISTSLRAGEQTAKQFAPVRTGFLRNSIGVRYTPQGGTLESKANYSGFVNFGTRYMAARPYFNQGVTRMREVWDDKWRRLESRLPRL